MSTRRNIIIGLGAMAAAGYMVPREAVTVTRPGTAFGTTVRLTVTAESETVANRAIDAGFAEIRSVHKAASLFDPNSEVSVLNRTGRLDDPTPMFREIMRNADDLHRLTRGAFDASVQPLWKAWADAKDGAPSDADLSQARQRVGWDKVESNGEGCRLRDDAALTFNGVAQGLAADRVLATLRGNGALAARIDTGETGLLNNDGELPVLHPRRGRPLGSLKLSSGFVAVSGDYASSFTSDFTHHHIFDPALGFSPRELASVVVVAPTGAMADGLATAFMVMGVKDSLSCLGKVPGCSALFVDKDGEVTLSPSMQPLFNRRAA